MSNGERIDFTDCVHFLFEIATLTYASPPTVSRLGIIFIAGTTVQHVHLLDRCINQQASRLTLEPILDMLILPALPFIEDKRSSG